LKILSNKENPMSNILIVNGSPRKKGNSATLAQQVATGAVAVGAQVETVFLHGMDIAPCNACDACLQTADPACVIDDDMQALYLKLLEADAIVLASPIYWFTISAQTKLFMDRCYAFEGSGENPLKDKRYAIVLAYGDSDPFNSGAVNALRTFQDGLAYIGAEIAGTVYGSASKPGEIAQNEELMEKAYQLGQQLGSSD
jgi:multimeric flavodoxin WrbA